jgi:hypothetical protein
MHSIQRGNDKRYNHALKELSDFYKTDTQALVNHLRANGESDLSISKIVGIRRSALVKKYPKDKLAEGFHRCDEALRNE